jgi:ankyrin repeat protein
MDHDWMPSVDEQLLEAVRAGETDVLRALLDEHPEGLQSRMPPYEWTLLHFAAQAGQLPVVDLLLERGLDPDVREKGDNTTPMFWAAASGHLDLVQRLAEAGGDVNATGDDHALDVIGWATCWEGCDDEAHRAVAAFLVSRGAKHHIYSAIAMGLADEVRRLVAADASQLHRRLSRNEADQLPLQFAVRMNRPAMVALLVELGADPLGTDGDGMPLAAYAMVPEIDRPVMERIRAMLAAELLSAERGKRKPSIMLVALLAVLALGDWPIVEQLVRAEPGLLEKGGAGFGALHLMSRRGDSAAVQWLLQHGADANALWPHWDAEVTPLHLAILSNHSEVVRILVAAGADPAIKDSKHGAGAIGWAEFFKRPEIVKILKKTA